MLYDMKGNPLFAKFDYDISVMSFNVEKWYGTNSNKDIMKQVILKNDPDIIGVQEYQATIGNENVSSAIFSGYPYITEGTTSTTHKAIVSKIEFVDFTDVAYQSKYEEVRSYNKCYFEYLGKRIALFNTHLELPQQAAVQVSQANQLFADAQKEDYFIITGDYNTFYATSTQKQHYTQFIKPFIDAGDHCANSSNQHGWYYTSTDNTSLSGALPWYPNDQIFTSGNIDIVAVNADMFKADFADGTYPIDHVPIIAYLKIN